MRDAVRDNFLRFTEKFEGYIPFFYLDTKGLVTIGYGNLQDPIVSPLLDFRKKVGGAPAIAAEVREEWARVKSLQWMKSCGGEAFANRTTLEATEESIRTLVDAEIVSFESKLRAHFPAWDEWSADAQLGVLSMAWAMGPDFPREWPHFSAAVNAKDFAAASLPYRDSLGGRLLTSCVMNEAGMNASFRMRNAANRVCFRNAAVAEDVDTLYWPRALP